MSKIKEFDDILIVGLGLIGGSIAKKIKEIDYSGNVYAVSYTHLTLPTKRIV